MTEDPYKKVPTQEQVFRIKDRVQLCRYYYSGIFQTRRNVLPLVLQGKMTNQEAAGKVESLIDTFYTCMTENKFSGIKNLPTESKNQLTRVKQEVIDMLVPESLCEHSIDKVYRGLFQKKLI